MTLLLTNDFPLSDDECQALQIDKREAHVAWLILHHERGEAAILRAGYRNSTSWDMLSLSKSYARAVEIMSKHFLQAVAAPAALAVQFKLLTAKDTAPGVKHQIGKSLMEMAGYGQEGAGSRGAVDLDKLDAATLDALIQDLESRKAGMARTISLDVLDDRRGRGSAPVSAPDDSELSDML